MNCNDNCINQGFFQGDDLVDVITVNRPSNSDSLTITRAELQVGSLTFVEETPVFPYAVSILRDKSMLLNYTNPVYLRIYYPNPNNNEIDYRTTCLGSLVLKVNAQVVEDVQQ